MKNNQMSNILQRDGLTIELQTDKKFSALKEKQKLRNTV